MFASELLFEESLVDQPVATVAIYILELDRVALS